MQVGPSQDLNFSQFILRFILLPGAVGNSLAECQFHAVIRIDDRVGRDSWNLSIHKGKQETPPTGKPAA